MPYAMNEGHSIHYETVGTGPLLVLCHGSFGSLEDWRDFGYVDALKSRRTLILFDSRGHGGSAKPHDPADYSLAARAKDVVAVLDDLGIETADYFGYSMGGWIGFGLARYAPHRITSFVLGGAHPYAEDMQPFRQMIGDDPAGLVASLAPSYGGTIAPAMRARLLKNDIAALKALTIDRADMSDVLPKLDVPVLLFVGTADPRHPNVTRCAKDIPNATFFEVPDRGHVATWTSIEMVLPHLLDFLDNGIGRQPRGPPAARPAPFFRPVVD